MPHVKITYTPNGQSKIEPNGYGGGLCQIATGPYQKRHGGEVTTVRTPEADMPEAVKQTDDLTQSTGA